MKIIEFVVATKCKCTNHGDQRGVCVRVCVRVSACCGRSRWLKESSNLEMLNLLCPFICTCKAFMGKDEAAVREATVKARQILIGINNIKKLLCDEFRSVQPRMLLGSDSQEGPFKGSWPSIRSHTLPFPEDSAHT